MTDEVWRAQHVIFEAGAARVLHCPVPVIAAVEGFAMGGGCELAVLSDFIVASETAVFAVPEVTLGIFPGIGGTQLLPRIIGGPLAKEMIFTGRRVAAAEAKAIGLVNHLVPAGQARAKALEIAAAIAANGPVAVRQAKKAINWGSETDLETGMALAIEAYNVTVTTEDRLEGVQSLQREAQAALPGESRDMKRHDLRADRGAEGPQGRGLRPLQAVPGRVLARARRQARVPRRARQRPDEGGVPRGAHPAGVRRGGARDHGGRADPRGDQPLGRQRRRLPRADVHHGHRAAPWLRAAEEDLPAEDRHGGAAPPGLRRHRAQRGLGHDEAPDHGDPQGRQLRGQRAEDVHLARAPVRPDAAARADHAGGPGEEEDGRAHRLPHRHPAAQGQGARGPAAQDDDEPLDQRALLRQHGDPRPTASSARRARASPTSSTA